MPDLTDELQRMAGEAARQAQPLTAADLLHRGDRRRRRALTQWSAGGATAAIAVAGVTLALTSAPAARHPAPTLPSAQLAAWTVTRQADGNIDLTVRQWHDVAGLQRTLRADGVPASVLLPGQHNPCQFYGGTQARLHLLPRVLSGRNVPAGPVRATTIIWVIHPSALPSGAGLQFGVDPIAISPPSSVHAQASTNPPRAVKVSYPSAPAQTRNMVSGFTLVKTSQACTGS
jgi:hypothetical protein